MTLHYNMGSLIGHLVPGTMFILLSLWWYINAVFACIKRRKGVLLKTKTSDGSTNLCIPRPQAWFPCSYKNREIPFEPVAKVVLAFSGGLLELLYESQYRLFDMKGDFVQSHLNNFAHSTMFSIFALSGLIDLSENYSLLPLPRGTSNLILSWGFFVEGLLFYNHLHGRSALNVHIHTFIYLLAFATAVVILLEIASISPLPLILRAYFTTVHGTWFYQVGFVLHGPSPWQNNERNVEFTTIALVWHMIAVFIVYAATYAVMHRVFSRMSNIAVHRSRILETESESDNDE